MHDKLFRTPIALMIGAGERLEIGTLSEAHRFLSMRPQTERGDAYKNARRACEAAAAGYVTMEQARRAVVAFAEAAGMLEPEVAPVAAARAVARGYGGFAA